MLWRMCNGKAGSSRARGSGPLPGVPSGSTGRRLAKYCTTQSLDAHHIHCIRFTEPASLTKLTAYRNGSPTVTCKIRVAHLAQHFRWTGTSAGVHHVQMIRTSVLVHVTLQYYIIPPRSTSKSACCYRARTLSNPQRSKRLFRSSILTQPEPDIPFPSPLIIIRNLQGNLNTTLSSWCATL